jgi:hypothetical protein
MSRVVWKYTLQPGTNVIPLPPGSALVNVGPSGYRVGGSDGFVYTEAPAVWIERDRDRSADYATPALRLVAVGTGDDVPEEATHVGSAWCGPFMWHVYRLADA